MSSVHEWLNILGLQCFQGKKRDKPSARAWHALLSIHECQEADSVVFAVHGWCKVPGLFLFQGIAVFIAWSPYSWLVIVSVLISLPHPLCLLVVSHFVHHLAAVNVLASVTCSGCWGLSGQLFDTCSSSSSSSSSSEFAFSVSCCLPLFLSAFQVWLVYLDYYETRQ